MYINPNSVTIYNASAGSGKTYTLVKSYLLKILSSPDFNRYRQILAITFTNKAVAEMKGRILGNLHAFSLPTIPSEQKSMFEEIKKELKYTSKELQVKSYKTLQYILHNYTAFNVQTIDKFTQSIVRTFAFDLNLKNNFEVELDTLSIIEKAIDELLNEVGNKPEITKVVIDFMKLSIEDDAQWNIKNSLLEAAKILLNEDDIPHLMSLKEKTIQDFENLQKELRGFIAENQQKAIALATQVLEKIEEKELVEHFTRGTIPNYFKKIKNNEVINGFTAKWQQNIKQTSFYNKGESDIIKAQIDELRPLIETAFENTKHLVVSNMFVKRVLKNIPQMSLLQLVQKTINTIKEQDNFLLISDFNQLIFNTIKNQPTPFIYERLGERYRDFYIDEFQDTSVVQWKNLIPLIDNAVSSIDERSGVSGSVTLLGDAKQAIYRWRGGKADQFIDLSNKKSPFSVEQINVQNLDTNYRSYSNIIEFNNLFFNYLSSYFLNKTYAKLYIEGNQQKVNTKQGGYVQFSFVEGENISERNEAYLGACYENVIQIVENGFSYKDICILVRRNSEAVLLAEYFSKNNIPITSNESLLVKNSNEVEFLISLTIFLLNKNEKQFLLNFLKSYASLFNIGDLDDFFDSNISKSPKELFESLGCKNVDELLVVFQGKNIYEAFEKLIFIFKVHENSNAHLQFFMDYVFEQSQKLNLGVYTFLENWNTDKEKLSLVVPEGQNSIQILSIHKSKGLEFPVVIYPFSETDIYDRGPKNSWFSINEFSEDFSEAYISFNKKIFEDYSEDSHKFQQGITELQELDNFNVLYVAFTRAKEQLYVIGRRKDWSGKAGNYSFYFSDFIQKNNFIQKGNSNYFGDSKKIHNYEVVNSKNIVSNLYFVSQKELHGINEVVNSSHNQNINTAIKKGLLTHEILSKIYSKEDIHLVFELYKNRIDSIEYQFLLERVDKIINHTIFENLFSNENIIYNEREFYYEGQVLRPDRIEITPFKQVFVIDYKTGEVNENYAKQVLEYKQIFKKMGYKEVKCYVIYINESLNFEECV